ncbi:MAG: hypothetical protein DRK00_04080 [Thermoprotei archaeon]|nr:MAG: hypothetical protein DRK00_04080 [Thermoprotei archaeon]HDD34202.1 hypothetical protein [Thermofilaceae archaeon]
MAEWPYLFMISRWESLGGCARYACHILNRRIDRGDEVELRIEYWALMRNPCSAQFLLNLVGSRGYFHVMAGACLHLLTGCEMCWQACLGRWRPAQGYLSGLMAGAISSLEEPLANAGGEYGCGGDSLRGHVAA